MADVVDRVCFVLYFVFTVCDLELIFALSQVELHPAADFSRHTFVKPRIYHGREKRQIFTTREKEGGHVHHLTVEYDVDNENYTLDLKLNRDLIPEGYFHRYQENGRNVVSKPTKENVELCHYHGKIRNVPESWAALSTCKGALSGVVYDGKNMHYLEQGPNGDTHLDNYHYLYKHSDIIQNNKTCGYSGDAVNEDSNKMHEYNRIHRYKRATDPIIRGPYNANKQSRYVELVLVVDNSLYKELGENIYRVEQHCKDITNIINALYSPLNIFVALVGVVTWSEKDEVQFSTNGDTTLTNFLHYRRRVLLKDHPNDNAQLITKFNFDHGVVGKALKGPICTYEFSGGVNNNHSPVIGLVATTIAHEMGHNFGMEHDTNVCTCPDDRCIMAPSSSSTPPQHWSSCSLSYIAVAFEHGMDYCLRNKPKALFGSPVCGNGFVEPGEQCDCGLPEHCDNSCCNAINCTLNSNASCATGECCDLNTCKPKKAGTMCRSADIECDLPEYCTGQSEYCPDDVYKMDTEVCDGGKAYCYHGFCRSRSDQCKLLWGNTGKSSDEQCYKMNTRGTRHGNCGYNKLDQKYETCGDEHVLCGMLHCKHLNERLEFGMESVAVLSHSFINLKGSIIPCRTALVDLGLNQVDPGLAPDGAKCGEGKMCVNQKCMTVDSLRYSGVKCPNDCNGNGVCNNLGHCHCKDGFAPPFCDYPGTGGSEDSGPASDPNARKEFVTAMFIIFLGIIPVMAIFGFIFYYARHNLKLTWNQSPTTYVTNCFVKSCQHVSLVCMGGGNTKKSVSTVSEHVSKQGGSIRNLNLEIIPTKLISTTNKDVINNSCAIKINTSDTNTYEVPKRRMSFKNLTGFKLNSSLKLNKLTSVVNETCSEAPGTSESKRDVINYTYATKVNNLSNYEVPKRRLSFKNIKGLKLNTALKMHKTVVNETPCDTPGTSETLCPCDEVPSISVKSLAKQFNYLNNKPNNLKT